MKTISSIATGLAVGVLLIGCGNTEGGQGDSEDEGFAVRADTTMMVGSLAKSTFIARANRICSHAWPVIFDNFTQYSSWQSPKLSERELFAKSVSSSFIYGLDFHIFDKIHALKAPRGEKTEVEDMIGQMQIAVEQGWKGHVIAHSPTQLSAHFADYNQAARRYGVDECLVDGRRLQLGKRR